ncbi:MAG: lysostaphin resistance A-like protein [Lachnospiraceae bacterium]
MTKRVRLTWEAIYPLIIYWVVVSTVSVFLKDHTRIGAYSEMLCEGVSKLICILPMYYFYQKNPFRKNRMHHKGKDAVVIIFIGITLSLGLNNLIELSPLKAMSPTFQRLGNAVYSDARIWQLLSVGLCAPILEELTFRGILFGNLRQAYGKWIGIIGSALIFGAFHFNLVQFVYAALLGVVFAYIYDKTGALWSCILAHAAANVFSLAATWYGISSYLSSTATMCLVSGIVALVASVVLLVQWKHV